MRRHGVLLFALLCLALAAPAWAGNERRVVGERTGTSGAQDTHRVRPSARRAAPTLSVPSRWFRPWHVRCAPLPVWWIDPFAPDHGTPASEARQAAVITR